MDCLFAVVNTKRCQELRYAVVPLLEHSVLTKAIILFKVVPVHAMMTCGRVDVYLYSFLTLTLGGVFIFNVAVT